MSRSCIEYDTNRSILLLERWYTEAYAWMDISTAEYPAAHAQGVMMKDM